MKSALILLASAAMLATTSAQLDILKDPTKLLDPSILQKIPGIGALLDPTKVVGVAEQMCKNTIGKAMPSVCDFSVLTQLMGTNPFTGCNPIPGIGGDLSIVVDLAISGNMTCPKTISVCLKGPGVLPQVGTLLQCALPQLPNVLSKVGTILKGALDAMGTDSPRALLFNAVLFFAYVLLKKVIEILCLQLPILLSVLITLGPIVFLVLLGLGLGLAASMGPLAALAPVVLLLAVLLGTIVSAVSLLLLGLVLVLEVLLIPLSGLLILLLALLLGIEAPCSNSACGSGSSNPLAGSPFASMYEKLDGFRCKTNDFFTKLSGFLMPASKGLLSPLLDPVLTLVSNLLPVVGGLLKGLLSPVADILMGLSKTATLS